MKERTFFPRGGTLADLVAFMSEGNPGAIQVMILILKEIGDEDGVFVLRTLELMGWRASQIYLAWQICGCDVPRMLSDLADYDGGRVMIESRAHALIASVAEEEPNRLPPADLPPLSKVAFVVILQKLEAQEEPSS